MTEKVSIHGGHSGQFCGHAQDDLETIVQAYLNRGFAWVGLTEHMPPTAPPYMLAEEEAQGFTVPALDRRFGDYIGEARRLQEKFRDRLEIFVAFETEAYPGAIEKALELAERYKPDYILGSIHHFDDICFDAGPEYYGRAVRAAGGLEALYCGYFDRQYELIQRVRPRVVGHFDLIRIYDSDYPSRLALPAVQERIARNLAEIRRLDLILDYNLAALRKGAAEPYISRPILIQAKDLGIAVVPGDDSHGASTVGAGLDEGIRRLALLGFDTRWRRPY